MVSSFSISAFAYGHKFVAGDPHLRSKQNTPCEQQSAVQHAPPTPRSAPASTFGTGANDEFVDGYTEPGGEGALFWRVLVQQGSVDGYSIWC